MSCSVCATKVRYATQLRAARARRVAQSHGGNHAPGREYLCGECGGWHLATKDQVGDYMGRAERAGSKSAKEFRAEIKRLKKELADEREAKAVLVRRCASFQDVENSLLALVKIQDAKIESLSRTPSESR